MAKDSKIEPMITPLQTFDSGFIAKSGHYHLIEVDENGNEVLGTDFGVGAYTYKRTYENNQRFKVKKSPIGKQKVV